MIDLEFYKNKLLEKYKEKNDDEMYERYEHSLNVCKFMEKLINHHNIEISKEKALLAAILHDYAKFYTMDEYEQLVLEYNLDSYVLTAPRKILHSLLGRYAVNKDLNIDDEDVLSAIEYHTTGKENMSLLQELLFVSDFCEDSRVGGIFEKARDLAFVDIKKCVFYILEYKIQYTLDRGLPLDPNTQVAYKYYKRFKNLNSNNKLDNVLECINKNLVKDVVIYDMTSRHPLYDYVIVSSTSSYRQMEACVSYLKDDFSIKGAEISEGWTLIDLGDIIVHVFTDADREKYGLDKLYSSLPIVENKIIK